MVQDGAGCLFKVAYNGRQLGEPWICKYFAKLLLCLGAELELKTF